MAYPFVSKVSGKRCPHCFRNLLEVIATGDVSCPATVECGYTWEKGSRNNLVKGLLVPIPADLTQEELLAVRTNKFEQAVGEAGRIFYRGEAKGEESLAVVLEHIAYQYGTMGRIMAGIDRIQARDDRLRAKGIIK